MSPGIWRLGWKNNISLTMKTIDACEMTALINFKLRLDQN